MKLPRKAHLLDAQTRVCALFPGALGDFICVLPALHHLARQAQLDVFARSEYADLVPGEIKVQSLERHEIARLFAEGGAQEARVRDFFSAYRRVYSWTGSGQPVFAQELNSVADAYVFPFRPANPLSHQMDYYYACVASQCGAPLPSVPVPPEALVWWQRYAANHALTDRPVLVIAPGSGAVEKNWPVRSFAEVADWWRHEKNGRVLTLLGPVEEERGGAEELSSNTVVLRSLSLGRAAALLSSCQLYLGNDSGMSHLAAAVGAPTVALFGPSDTTQWSPRGKSVKVLSLDVDCSPCGVSAIMKSCPHRKCLTTLTPDQVIACLAQIVDN